MPFLSSNSSLLAHQQRVWGARSGDVFSLVADDCCDSSFEVFGSLDCSLHCGVYLLASFGASEATIFSKPGSPRSGSQKGKVFITPY